MKISNILSGFNKKNTFVELEYLTLYPDVAAAVKAGTFKSGYEHYEKHGKSEGPLVVIHYLVGSVLYFIEGLFKFKIIKILITLI